jgi:hypothetical protein
MRKECKFRGFASNPKSEENAVIDGPDNPESIGFLKSTEPQSGEPGKTPIRFQSSVSFDSTPASLSVTSTVLLEPYMTLDFAVPGTLALNVENAEVKKQRSMWGLTRTLIQNAFPGMTEGFAVPLYLVDIGYRAALEADPR